jgi:hypothetical protein
MLATETAVRERPILMSAPMVRAILAGTKTQTRRVIQPQPANPQTFGSAPCWGCGVHRNGAHAGRYMLHAAFNEGGTRVDRHLACPYGAPGDRLWGREAWASPGDMRVAYRADGDCGSWMGDGGGGRFWNRHGYIIEVDKARGPSWGLGKFGGRWRPSIHMPRWASRITLEITRVGVEQVQEIGAGDAHYEGVCADPYHAPWLGCRQAFRAVWDSLNAERGYGWDANPWVWALTFRRVEG